MENFLPLFDKQEIIFGSSDQKISKQIAQLEVGGRIRKIAPRIYSSNLTEPIEHIIKRNLWPILSHLYPGALVSHRSAFEYQLTKADCIFLTFTYTKKIKLPGVTINLLEGHSPLENDNPFFDRLFASQKARAFLENLQTTRNIGPTSKCLSLPQLEEKLEEIIRVHGEEELNNIRDKARTIATVLNMQVEFEKLNKLIGALLSTNSQHTLSSPPAIARSIGFPYDVARVELLGNLFQSLQTKEFKYIQDKNSSMQSFRNFAFFESYFSNYIEGTVFEVEEAKQIIETDSPIPMRHEDSHDVLGTYNILSNREEMSITPNSSEELLNMIASRHKMLLSARIDKKPGQFKDKNNFAGQTEFVDFNLVRGTLMQSFKLYKALQHPFAKAAYMMFMISEVHPFLDGNGRIARVMMNAELVAAGQSKIIIPTVFREDYMGVLRKLTRQQDPEPYIRMLQRAQEFSATIYAEDMDVMQAQLQQSNAFEEHTEAKLKIIIRKE